MENENINRIFWEIKKVDESRTNSEVISELEVDFIIEAGRRAGLRGNKSESSEFALEGDTLNSQKEINRRSGK